MAEQKDNIGNIYPNLPYLVLDKIMRYHREANAEIEPKKTIKRELKNVKQYSCIFYRNLKPSLFKNLKRLPKMDKKHDEILDLYHKIGPGEVEYFKIVMVDEIVHGSFTVRKEGIVIKLQENKVVLDENDKNWRFG